MKKTIQKINPTQIKKALVNWKKKIEFKKTLRSSDVFLVGHPKSGNTWLAYMLAIVLTRENSENVTMANVGNFVPNIHFADTKIAELQNHFSPRIFRNEAPVFADLYPKTIYIIRDPRAVILSYYHHWLHTDRQDHGTIDDFVMEMLSHGHIRGWENWLVRWDIQVNDWLNRSRYQPVKIVRYEDLLENREKIFADIVKFCGINVDSKWVSLAVNRGEFKKMQNDEKIHGAESYPGQDGSKGFFIRKGKADSWKDEMPEYLVNKIESQFFDTMKKTGYL